MLHLVAGSCAQTAVVTPGAGNRRVFIRLSFYNRLTTALFPENLVEARRNSQENFRPEPSAGFLAVGRKRWATCGTPEPPLHSKSFPNLLSREMTCARSRPYALADIPRNAAACAIVRCARVSLTIAAARRSPLNVT